MTSMVVILYKIGDKQLMYLVEMVWFGVVRTIIWLTGGFLSSDAGSITKLDVHLS